MVESPVEVRVEGKLVAVDSLFARFALLLGQPELKPGTEAGEQALRERCCDGSDNARAAGQQGRSAFLDPGAWYLRRTSTRSAMAMQRLYPLPSLAKQFSSIEGRQV
jgi:hypothetical protein